jgi:hypothetical protein
MIPAVKKYFLLFFTCIPLCINIYGQRELFNRITTQHGLSGNIIYDIKKDTKGNLWFATASGITRYDGRTYKRFDIKSGLPENIIINIETDPEGTPWFRTFSGQLYYYSNNKIHGIPVNPELAVKLKDKVINSSTFNNSGEIFISTVTGGGLFKISADKKQVTIEEPLPGDCSYFLRINSGNYITGTENVFPPNNKLLLSWDGRNQIIILSSGNGYSKSTVIKKSPGKYLFASGFEILTVGSRGIESRVLFENSIENLYLDGEKKLWVGFNNGGVRCFPNGDIASGRYLRYLGDKTITSFAEDNNGNLWIGTTAEGVYFLPSKVHLSNNSAQKKNINEEMHEIDNILLSDNLETLFNDSLNVDTVPPEIFISGIVIKERDTTINSSYTLKHDQNYIRINFAGFSKNRNGHLQYKYKMTNVDNDWVFTSASSVQYTTLPPGNYFFEVSAVNIDGYWSSEPAIVTFVIKPPYWETWWFRTGAGVSAATFFIFFLTYREKRIKQREREKVLVEKKMSDLELKALRAQMNPHFIFNSLNSIQNFVINNDIDSAIRYQSKFSRLIRNILENSKKSQIPLDEELKSLEIYLELESLRFENKFNYQIEIDEDIQPGDVEIPPMLIQPYVENAIWHGLMHKQSKGLIKIKIHKKNNLIICVVEDDGVGRQKALELESRNKTTKKSMGMSITKERLEIINSGRNSSLNVDIEDLKDKDGVPAGTRVNIFIPCEI